VIVVPTVGIPLSPLLLDTYGQLLVVTIWVWAALFAVSSLRHGTGLGRVSAVLSLVILVASVVYVGRPVK
jgi:hypothetical protein